MGLCLTLILIVLPLPAPSQLLIEANVLMFILLWRTVDHMNLIYCIYAIGQSYTIAYLGIGLAGVEAGSKYFSTAVSREANIYDLCQHF